MNETPKANKTIPSTLLHHFSPTPDKPARAHGNTFKMCDKYVFLVKITSSSMAAQSMISMIV